MPSQVYRKCVNVESMCMNLRRKKRFRERGSWATRHYNIILLPVGLLSAASSCGHACAHGWAADAFSSHTHKRRRTSWKVASVELPPLVEPGLPDCQQLPRALVLRTPRSEPQEELLLFLRVSAIHTQIQESMVFAPLSMRAVREGRCAYLQQFIHRLDKDCSRLVGRWIGLHKIHPIPAMFAPSTSIRQQ